MTTEERHPLPDVPYYRAMASGHRNRTGHELEAVIVTGGDAAFPRIERTCCQPGDLVRDGSGEPVRELHERDRRGQFVRPWYGFARCGDERPEEAP